MALKGSGNKTRCLDVQKSFKHLEHRKIAQRLFCLQNLKYQKVIRNHEMILDFFAICIKIKVLITRNKVLFWPFCLLALI